MNNKFKLSLIIIAVFLVGMLTNHYWTSTNDAASATSASKRKILYWVAPMNPEYRRDKPGKSPMGMDLVPVYEGEQDEDRSVIKISPAVVNNLGVKVTKVKRMNISHVVDTVGYVTVDENNIEHIHTYADGWIKELNVKTTGETVTKGQLLLELYSPTLNNAQEELLLALKNKNSTLIRAGEKKLITLGMSQTQINQIKKTRRVAERVKIYATQAGVVSQLNVREGKFVKPDTDLMTIEDLSRIWMIAEVFERQASWVKEGQAALATLPYMPGKNWQGSVDYVYPELDQKTHTLRVRLVFPNPDLTIKPKMYANIKIFSQAIKNALVIPREALIRTGEGDRVILALGNGRFKAQPIKVGIESGEYYQVLSGLTSKEMVVTSAQFLIDSESNLKAGLKRLENHKSSIEDTSHQNSIPQELIGVGEIKKINHDKETVVIHHQPIPALNMPAMTMDLKVDKRVNLQELQPGEKVHFVMEKQSDGHYLVLIIHVIEPKK